MSTKGFRKFLLAELQEHFAKHGFKKAVAQVFVRKLTDDLSGTIGVAIGSYGKKIEITPYVGLRSEAVEMLDAQLRKKPVFKGASYTTFLSNL